MLEKVAPDIRELDKVRLGANALAAINALPPARRDQLQCLLEEIGREHPPEPPSEQESTSTDAYGQALGQRLDEIFRDDHYAIASFLDGIARAMAGPSRIAIVYNSLLIMAVSAFEVLISGLLARYFITFPDALNTEKKEFSLDDVQGFKSEEDAIDLLLSRRISGVMYGGLDEWRKWFESYAQLNLSDLAIDWESTREIFQRRHIVTHSGGLVSAEYLAKVKVAGLPMLGSRLAVDESYLHAALDQLDALGTALGVRVWSLWFPDQRNDSASALLQRTYQTMLLGRWPVTEKLAGTSIRCEEQLRYSIRCNGWLSVAERSGYEAIREEVSQWDASALSGRFKLVRLVLLQDLDAALALVPALLAAEEIHRGELREWPILRTLREHPGYESVAQSEGV
jgi:hypothetical protein